MMNLSEFAAWLCCLDDREAFEIWKTAFQRRDVAQGIDPSNALMNHYYADPLGSIGAARPDGLIL